MEHIRKDEVVKLVQLMNGKKFTAFDILDSANKIHRLNNCFRWNQTSYVDLYLTELASQDKLNIEYLSAKKEFGSVTIKTFQAL